MYSYDKNSTEKEKRNGAKLKQNHYYIFCQNYISIDLK